ncbi:MAG TPA: PhoX family phosphatase [Geminicoccaceae bacterium]|nr:PhoX family phosphatase [Geminicoccaceae bacterium]
MKTLDQKYAPIVINDGDDIGSNRSANQPLLELAKTRMSRRTALKGFVTTAAVGALGGTLTSRFALAAEGGPSTLGFQSLEQVITEDHAVAPGYGANVLIRWGDPVLPEAPAFDPMNQTPEAQEKQFGYNCDYLAYFPLPRGSDNSEHGLLHANHEYTSHELMFPGWTKVEAAEAARQAAAWAARLAALEAGMTDAAVEQAAAAAAEEAEAAGAIEAASLAAQTPEQSRIEMMAHNGSVIEVRKENGAWTVVPDSQYARRITLDTEMQVSGPAAGHERLKTNADPTGTKVSGTINNCAGGKTPWGTVLMAEENFHGYFGGELAADSTEAGNHERYGVPGGWYAWWRSQDRFDIGKEPNEPNRYGWMVEYDPYDPDSLPVKRTALGRMKHEGATSFVNQDGRVVLYTGDDERFEYLYRFVTSGTFDPNDPDANRDLLDDGTLSVARFDESKVTWLPLVFGEGPLTAANGFNSQADVVIEARRAADLLGATPMDRPEDVEPNPVNGRVYVLLTNNTRRKPEQVDAVNPRADNAHGQVVELIPPGGAGKDADHTADQFDWDFLLIAGDPKKEGSGAKYHPDTEAWISSPDNCAFDNDGRIWISTDQGGAQAENNIPDGMYACDLSGDGRAYIKFFYACPVGAEMCGPEFTPDGRTLFVAVQHPAEADDYVSTFENPTTRWPDFAAGAPPRPAVVVITKDDGGPIGS